MKTITIAKDFSDTPGGRHVSDGPASGEAFRRNWLVPSLRSTDRVRVIFDGTSGYGSSFLEEAFGGLIRLEGFTKPDLDSRLELIAHTPTHQFYRDKARGYIDRASKISSGNPMARH